MNVIVPSPTFPEVGISVFEKALEGRWPNLPKLLEQSAESESPWVRQKRQTVVQVIHLLNDAIAVATAGLDDDRQVSAAVQAVMVSHFGPANLLEQHLKRLVHGPTAAIQPLQRHWGKELILHLRLTYPHISYWLLLNKGGTLNKEVLAEGRPLAKVLLKLSFMWELRTPEASPNWQDWESQSSEAFYCCSTQGPPSIMEAFRTYARADCESRVRDSYESLY